MCQRPRNGDCGFDYSRPMSVAGVIEAEAAAIIASGAQLFSLGGDHFVTWPLLKAHAARYGALALVQFDAHQDTWPDKADSISHGSFVAVVGPEIEALGNAAHMVVEAQPTVVRRHDREVEAALADRSDGKRHRLDDGVRHADFSEIGTVEIDAQGEMVADGGVA